MGELIYSALKDLARIIHGCVRSKLSQEEQDILTASGERGEIWISQVNGLGKWVRAGKTPFCNQNDFAYNAKYIDALEILVARGLVRYESGNLFRLTGRGFELANELKNVIVLDHD